MSMFSWFVGLSMAFLGLWVLYLVVLGQRAAKAKRVLLLRDQEKKVSEKRGKL